MKNVWTNAGGRFYLSEVSNQQPLLEKGVYKVQVDPKDNLYLAHIQDKFNFPYKVYGVENSFIKRVIKSYNETTGNFGVLLNGTKGTGKTVTAEILCNELALPVIIVSFHHSGLVSFLNDIQQDVIVFIDEFEKIYDGYDKSLLSIMDGALKTKHRLFFLLTTNELRVDRNLLQRPSRIRYVKTFSDMTLDVIIEVVDDLLIHKHLREQTITMISQLPLITMDLVKSIIQEVNIHNEDPNEFKEVFNIHADTTNLYDVYKIVDGKKEQVERLAIIYPAYITTLSVGDTFRINNRFIGNISEVFSENQVSVKVWEEDEKEEEVEKTYIYYFEKATKIHRAFASVPTGLAF